MNQMSVKSNPTSRMFYCFMGAPGVGKGTQAVLLSQKLGLKHISTGVLLRQAVAESTPLGLKADEFIQKGRLVPDSIMVDLVKEVLKDLPENQGAILDGFPRTLVQAKGLDDLMEKQNLKLSQCVLFQLDEEILVERITGRRVAPQSGKVYHIKFAPPKTPGICDESGEELIQRPDDKEEVIRARFKEYQSQQAPLLEYYQKKGILTKIEAQGSPEEVYQRMQAVLGF